MIIEMTRVVNVEKLVEELMALPRVREVRIAGEAISVSLADGASPQEIQAVRDAITNHNPAAQTAEQQDTEFIRQLPADSSTWTLGQTNRALAVVLRRLGLRV